MKFDFRIVKVLLCSRTRDCSLGVSFPKRLSEIKGSTVWNLRSLMFASLLSFAFLIFRDLLSVPPPPSNEENEAQMWPQRQPTSVLEKPAPRCSGWLSAKSRKHWKSPPPDKTAFLYREIGTQSVSLGPSFRAIICSHILQHRQSRGATSAASSDALGVSARRTGTLL